MTYKILRRGSIRFFGILAAFITISLCLCYIYLGQFSLKDFYKRPFELYRAGSWEKCIQLNETSTKITTVDEFSKFDFQPKWMTTREYWDKSFESRYDKLKKDGSRRHLKVIIVPHSHNDPGWLKTFENYFQSDTRQILNLIITKMQEYTDMTFIWSEISFLQLWWEQAHPTKRRALKQLIQSGRFEITTGGWVMTDEANVHIYAMVDQLIEGHQWVKANLNYTPITGWSIDPFGHGSTVPYLLSASGFKGTIIQRIHYAWKQWLAEHQYGDFIWEPYWSNNDEIDSRSLLTHNMPFDIYSIKSSCGPRQLTCLSFDFRKIPGVYTESLGETITDKNIKAKASLLVEQYARTASLFPHNVALIPIGDDFRYNQEREVDQQYTNYKKLIDYINAHREVYKTEISFGLPKDYFQAIQERSPQFPTLKGDFFVYSDIFSEGKPAYWSGYFTTRPMYKMLSRELESQLRSTETLFTVAFNTARQTMNHNALRIFEKNYEKIVQARRNLGLFQHHDAITGTSKDVVMRDYGIRMYESILDVMKLQESSIESLILKHHTNPHSFVLNDMERGSFNELPKKLPISIPKNNTRQFLAYNSGTQDRLEIITIRTESANVEIWNNDGVQMEIQINPVWSFIVNTTSSGVNATSEIKAFGKNVNTTSSPVSPVNATSEIKVSGTEFEVLFLAKLPAMSLSTFTVRYTEDYETQMATIYCDECKDGAFSAFKIHERQPGDIKLENSNMMLLIDQKSGFLKAVTKKNSGKAFKCGINFATYGSTGVNGRSGAYLFRPDPGKEDNILKAYKDVKMFITIGPIASDLTVMYSSFLMHTIRIFNTKTDVDNAIYIENNFQSKRLSETEMAKRYFDPSSNNKDIELFMRFTTVIENGENPTFYTDLNGFQYQKRVKVPSIGIEGNYFPITTAAFIQDEETRLTLLTQHAHAATSYTEGQLEVMIYRRNLFDDNRGMGEGVEDGGPTRHKFWLLIENFQEEENHERNEYQVPSLFSNHLSNGLMYPSNVYFIDNQTDYTNLDLNSQVKLLPYKFPCDLHMLTLRTLTDEEFLEFPSRSALMVLHRQAYSCKFMDNLRSNECVESVLSKDVFNSLQIESISSTTLTGLKTNEIIEDFSSIYVKPMDIRTFNLTFI